MTITPAPPAADSDVESGSPPRPAAATPLMVGAGVVVVLGIALFAIRTGVVTIDTTDLLADALNPILPWQWSDGLSDQHEAIVWKIRAPRVILGLLVGGLLASAGAAYQGVFRNPLADPYLLGIAAGAGFGATIVFVGGWGDGQGVFDLVRVAAFAGALAAVGLTYLVGVLGDRSRSSISLVLAGVAVASFFTAMQTFVQQRDDETISRVYRWILGSLTGANWTDVVTLLPYTALTTVVLVLSGRVLDLLSVGDEEATALGLNVGRTRLLVILVASLATAAAVAVSGLIAFVGLIIPHTVRLIFGSSYRIVVPLSFLLGAGFLMACDLVARTIFPPAELPIGVVTAFFGAPFFIVILRTAKLR